MTKNIPRAAQHNLVMAQLAVPKPTKATREKKPAKRIPHRKIVEQQLEDIVKMIVFWRDSQQCVEREIDGGRCGNGLAWGHLVPRSQSRYLKYDLATFVQCGSHNNLHDKGAPVMGVWFVGKFGTTAYTELDRIAREHANTKQRPIDELEDTLAYYTELYQNRNFVALDLLSLVRGGYYGQTIASAWMQDRRIK